jgi:nucleoid-associated protein EbfC
MSDMPNMNDLLSQAMRMQEQLLAAQQEAAQTVVEGVAGGGMVKVLMSANGEFHSVKINPKAVDPDDVGMLEDLVLAALHDCVAQAADVSQNATQHVMGGMDLSSLGFGGFDMVEVAPGDDRYDSVDDDDDDNNDRPQGGSNSALGGFRQ